MSVHYSQKKHISNTRSRKSSYRCSSLQESLPVIHSEKSIPGSRTLPLTRCRFWAAWEIWIKRRPSTISCNVGISTADLEAASELRAMLLKVCRLLCRHYCIEPLEVFVCVAALSILDRLDEVDGDTLAWWLAERQLPNGGLNGRPEKLEDVWPRFLSQPFSHLIHISRYATAFGFCRLCQYCKRSPGLMPRSWPPSFSPLK